MNIRGTPADLLYVQGDTGGEGKRAGALVRLCRCVLHTPLPGIFLSNVRSPPNKLVELQLMVGKTETFFTFSFVLHRDVAVRIDTGLCAAAGSFTLFRADRDTELKTKGAGICFYTDSGWCNDVTVTLQHCSPDLETFLLPL